MFNELLKIGLSENEAKVYLALLELGAATAEEIAKKAEVKRPTTYVQLEELRKMGLVTTFEKAVKKGGAEKTFFRAEDPEYLKKIVERDKEAIVDQEGALQKALPELQKIFSFSSERPKVRFFEGPEGLKVMQDELLKSNAKEVLGFSSADDIFNIFPTHPSEYTPRRVKKGIRAKIIYTTDKGPILKTDDERMLRDSRYLPKEKFPFSSDVTIYDNKIALSALRGNPVGVIIENKELSDSMRAVFDLAWETAEKYQ